MNPEQQLASSKKLPERLNGLKKKTIFFTVLVFLNCFNSPGVERISKRSFSKY